jgi:hypothetical protein
MGSEAGLSMCKINPRYGPGIAAFQSRIAYVEWDITPNLGIRTALRPADASPNVRRSFFRED